MNNNDDERRKIANDFYQLAINNKPFHEFYTKYKDILLVENASLYNILINSLNGYCFLLFYKGRLVFQNSNTFYKKFEKLYLKKYPKITECSHFKELLAIKPLHIQFSVQTDDNKTLLYDCTATPTKVNNEVTSIIICTSDITSIVCKEKGLCTDCLTKREKEIIEYVCNGEKNNFIAHHLNISEGTVKRIISNAYKKLNVSSRYELIKLSQNPNKDMFR